FIADRVTPAFRFCLVNSTLAYVTPIRYFYFLLLSLIIVSPTILKDDCLNDAECFTKIEKIVCLFEESGVGCGSRHDFG
ncbi:MAG: hypothetical protein ACOYJR_04765, partial [Acutalibacteraceae bacterium]